jgi:hypothetical protein
MFLGGATSRSTPERNASMASTGGAALEDANPRDGTVLTDGAALAVRRHVSAR